MKNNNATANALRTKIPRVVCTGYMSWWIEKAMYTQRKEDRMYLDSVSNDSYNVLVFLSQGVDDSIFEDVYGIVEIGGDVYTGGGGVYTGGVDG